MWSIRRFHLRLLFPLKRFRCSLLLWPSRLVVVGPTVHAAAFNNPGTNMRQFVAILQPVVLSPAGRFEAKPALVCRGEIPVTPHFMPTELPREQMLKQYQDLHPEFARIAHDYLHVNKHGGISHIVWDGSVKDLLRETPKNQRKAIKDLLRQAIHI